MTTTARQDLWELASVIAFERLGLVPLRKVDVKVVPPTAELAAMTPEESRKARRKYRKLWRRSLQRELKEFSSLPRRHRKEVSYIGSKVRGVWGAPEDALDGYLRMIKGLEVGSKPSRSARGYRWDRVKGCNEFRKILLEVAAGFGLLDPQRSM